MSRRIVCEKCAVKRGTQLHPEDAAMGFEKRVVKIIAKKPDDHAIIINGEKQAQMPSLVCDDCGDAIRDGTTAVAISLWRGGILEAWEHEYGQIQEVVCQ